MDNEVELTELYDLEVARHDGVERPASGFNFLVTKSAAPAATEPEGNMNEETIEPAVKDETPAAPATSETEGATAPEVPATVEKAVFDALAERVEKVESALAEASKRAETAEGEKEAAVKELEALKATPIPGGPVLAATDQDRVFKAKAEAVRKSAYWQHLADTVPNRELASEYAKRAAAESAAAK